jgi:1,4-alpha-glucan branching enzyme
MAAVADKRNGGVTFVLNGYAGAKEVYLAGEFNGWDPSRKRMSKYRDGSFRARLSLQPGEYQYKFVADGAWVPDAEAPQQVANPFGTVNSLVRVS